MRLIPRKLRVLFEDDELFYEDDLWLEVGTATPASGRRHWWNRDEKPKPAFGFSRALEDE